MEEGQCPDGGPQEEPWWAYHNHKQEEQKGKKTIGNRVYIRKCRKDRWRTSIWTIRWRWLTTSSSWEWRRQFSLRILRTLWSFWKRRKLTSWNSPTRVPLRTRRSPRRKKNTRRSKRAMQCTRRPLSPRFENIMNNYKLIARIYKFNLDVLELVRVERECNGRPSGQQEVGPRFRAKTNWKTDRGDRSVPSDQPRSFNFWPDSIIRYKT